MFETEDDKLRRNSKTPSFQPYKPINIEHLEAIKYKPLVHNLQTHHMNDHLTLSCHQNEKSKTLKHS